MSKFCENCGAEMEDNDTICKYCSPATETTVEEPVTDNTTVNTNSNASSSANTKNIAIIAGIAAFIIILLVIIFSIFTGGYEKPIKNYFKGMEKGNADTYLKAYPEFMDMDKTIDEDAMEDMLDGLEDEYGEKIKVSYKITKKEKIKKDDLETIKKYVDKKYEEDVKVSAGYEVKVRATIKGKDDEDTDTSKMYVYKVDGKWYLLNVSPDTAEKYIE